MDGEQLSCPTCGRAYPPTERFCEDCGMPLVQRLDSGSEATSESQRRARKVMAQYTEGPLVKVARASDLIQAEFIAGLLLEEGIPSYLSSPIAGHGPLAGGRDVLVPQSGADAARDVLGPRRG